MEIDFIFHLFPMDENIIMYKMCRVLIFYYIIIIIAGAIFEQGTDEVQSAFKFAMLNHNLNVTGRRFELQAYVDLISTADAFKLSRLSEYCDVTKINKYNIIFSVCANDSMWCCM